MNASRHAMLICAALLWSSPHSPGGAPATVGGFYYGGTLDDPLPGALVALYRADDNLLVGHTYTLDNGSFTLPGPPAAGRFYVVATKGQTSRRADFDYDPRQPPPNLMIQSKAPSGAGAKALGYMLSRFEDVIKVLIGLSLGLAFKFYEDRRKSRLTLARQLSALQDCRAEIMREYKSLTDGSAEYRNSKYGEAQRGRDKFVHAASKIKKKVDELQKLVGSNPALEEASYTVHKQKGLKAVRGVQRELKEIGDLVESAVGDPDAFLNRPPAEQEKLLEPFASLNSNYLMKDG